MNVYRRYFKVATGPIVAALQEHREVTDRAYAEYTQLCLEVGADTSKFYQTRGKLTGFVFNANEPDTAVLKRGDYGWSPRKNTKKGRELAKRISAVKSSDVKDCLKVVGLANDLVRIFSDRRAYSAVIIDVPADPPWALITVPWYDENPEVLAQYRGDKRRRNSYSRNLDALLWEPTSDMVEIKEWQFKKEIDDWNESIKAKEGARHE